MRTDIKFAGIALSWTTDQAQKRNQIYQEMGFLTKIINFQGAAVIAYSYKQFTIWEAKLNLEQIYKGYEEKIE